MITACSDRCGWCGRCDDPDDFRPNSTDRQYLFCDECGKDAFYPISLSGVGIFCSTACADKGAAKHETAMDRVRR